MNNYIVYPLMILIFVGAFSQVYYYTSIDFTSTPDYYNVTGTYNQTLEEETSTIGGEDVSVDMSFNMTVGLTALIVAVTVLAIIGATVLGSKVFSEHGQKMVVNSAIWYGLWGIFSVFGYNAIVALPLFGAFIWFFLTIIYSIGVFGRMSE